MEIFSLGLLWSSAVFFLFGTIAGVRISFLNRLEFSFLENFWFYLFIGISYVVFLGAKIILLAGVAGLILHNLFSVSPLNLSLIYLGSALVFLTYFFTKWYITEEEIPSTIISFIPAFILVHFKQFVSLEVINSLSFVWLALLIAVSFVSALIRTFSYRKSLGKLKTRQPLEVSNLDSYPLDKRLVFIGLDGCDWKLFNDFLNQGKLPNLSKLVDSGILTKVKTVQPTDSPLIWNSILSGKTPSEHGITFWYKTKFPFLPPIDKELRYPADSRSGRIVKKLLKHKIAKRVPFSTNDRKVKAIWNILTDYNKTSLNLGWLYSWPAEKIKGVQVSWYMYPFEEAAKDNIKRVVSTELPQRTYPELLKSELSRFIVRTGDLETEELSRMYFPTESIDSNKQFANKLNPWDYAKDKTFLKMSHYLLDKKEDYDFFSLYLYGIDAVCHTYWPFFKGATNNQKYKKEVLSVGETDKFKQEAQDFNKTIERYYQYLDEELGKLLNKVGNDCNIVIASDHGFDFDASAHENAPDGIFIACGPYIREAKQSMERSIYDVMPVLLTLLGLPVASDMQGELPVELFTDQFLNKFPPRFIDSHEDDFKQPKDDGLELDEATRKGIEERLKSLGYID